jgi:hypothetical protein
LYAFLLSQWMEVILPILLSHNNYMDHVHTILYYDKSPCGGGEVAGSGKERFKFFSQSQKCTLPIWLNVNPVTNQNIPNQ